MKQSKLFNKTATPSQIDAANDCLIYILDSEENDFDDQPDKNHIFFKAYVACYGFKAANAMLHLTIKSQDKISQKCKCFTGD